MSQTKQQYMLKVRELLRKQNAAIIERAEELWRSGAFDPKDYDNNYVLPKAAVSQLDREAGEAWGFLSGQHDELVKNLEHF